MKVQETNDKYNCDNCCEYTYVFEILTRDGVYNMRLCKKCLLELLKAIIER